MKICWEKLKLAGYRKIGFAIMQHEPAIQDDHDRLGNALAYLQYTNPDDRIPPLRCGFGDAQSYLQWIRAHQPEAIIGFNNSFKLARLQAGFGNIPHINLHIDYETGSEKCQPLPTETGIIEDKALLAKAVLQRMDSMIRHSDTGAPSQRMNTVIEPRWNEGKGIPTLPS